LNRFLGLPNRDFKVLNRNSQGLQRLSATVGALPGMYFTVYAMPGMPTAAHEGQIRYSQRRNQSIGHGGIGWWVVASSNAAIRSKFPPDIATT